jgi:hypothetical protein
MPKLRLIMPWVTTPPSTEKLSVGTYRHPFFRGSCPFLIPILSRIFKKKVRPWRRGVFRTLFEAALRRQCLKRVICGVYFHRIRRSVVLLKTAFFPGKIKGGSHQKWHDSPIFRTSDPTLCGRFRSAFRPAPVTVLAPFYERIPDGALLIRTVSGPQKFRGSCSF